MPRRIRNLGTMEYTMLKRRSNQRSLYWWQYYFCGLQKDWKRLALMCENRDDFWRGRNYRNLWRLDSHGQYLPRTVFQFVYKHTLLFKIRILGDVASQASRWRLSNHFCSKWMTQLSNHLPTPSFLGRAVIALWLENDSVGFAECCRRLDQREEYKTT